MPDPYPPPPSTDEMSRYFPLERPPLADDTFELGLVLGGTVSAGAYTAGVLDMLMQALDCWTRAKERGDPAAPRHRVVISTIGGTSGGAINGAILLRAAGWSFPHGAGPRNPFYSSWTSGVDLTSLLSSNADPGASGFASVFNCAAIDAQAASTIAFSGGPLGQDGAPGQRSYFSDPLRLFMMVGNVTGMPYRIRMRGETGLSHDLVSHVDYMRFALTVNGGTQDPVPSRPDEFPLESNSAANWDRLGAAALATSAFPLAFRARSLQRSVDHCRWRATLIPGDLPGTAEVAPLIPCWETLLQGEPNARTVNFVNVDGGTMNNEPLDVVRTALAGMNGRNRRGGGEADRAVVLIDPFSDPESLGPAEPQGLVGMAMPLIASWIYQARFKPADIALANAESVFSRFLVAPVGPGPNGTRTVGKAAIAAGGLGGFLGFVHRSFLEYDYALGRRNAYTFLQRHFAFPDTNPIFQSGWTDAQRQAQTTDTTDGVRYIRMIPLMPDLPEPPELTAQNWPVLPGIPNELPRAVEQRLQAVYDLAMQEVKPGKWYQRWLLSGGAGLAWRLYARAALRDRAVDVIRQGLVDQKLLPAPG